MPRIHSRAARVGSALVASLLLLVATACGESAEHRRADSLHALASIEQQKLADQLAEQKDSLMTVVLDADKFIGEIDSSIARVKGLPSRSRDKAEAEGVLQQQLEARKDMLFKVNALVKRAQATAAQLADAKRREAGLRDENTTLRDTLSRSEQLIASLGETIRRQATQITDLQATVMQLADANAKLGEELKVTQASSARVYYVIGREEELLAKGIIVREGGMNLLVMRAGRTVTPARNLDPAKFTAIDAREVSHIAMPDPTRRYRIVSRHSLDDAVVSERKDATFKGDLHISDPTRFWASSRYLIVIQG